MRNGELPVILLIIAVLFGAIIAILRVYAVEIEGGMFGRRLEMRRRGVGILAGTCFVIYKASKEKLMGEGLDFGAGFSFGAGELVVGALDNFFGEFVG